MKRKILYTFLGLLLAAISLWGLSFRSGSSPVQVPAAPVSRDNSFLAGAPGLVEPASEERLVGSEIIGTLRSVVIEENDRVTADQVIAVVKNDDQMAILAQAKAQLDTARATLVEAAKHYRRNTALEKSNAASVSALETARKDFDCAKAGVKLAEAAEQLAQANLDKTLIRSPVNGVVLKKLVVAGQAVSNQPPTPIAVIGDLSCLRVRAEVDELDIGKVYEGQRVEIKADAFHDLRAGGVVIRVNKRMGPRQVQTDRSSERVDSKVLQTLIELDKGVFLPVGLRVDVYFIPKAASGKKPQQAREKHLH